MRILFVHQNFPGQFKSLAPALSARGHEVTALRIGAADVSGVTVVPYAVTRGTSPGIHRWAPDFETKLIRAEGCGAAAEGLRVGGYTPDVIVGHPGWGEMLFLRDIWPRARQLHFLEFYYAAQGTDVGFDPEFPVASWQDAARTRAKNANGLLNLESMDAAYSPTEWQRSSFPSLYWPKIQVVHDGIDTNDMLPNPDVRLTLEQGRAPFVRGDEIVTFVNRNLEPYRGYHVFMRALPRLQALCPNALILIVGGNGVSYGAAAPNNRTWKEIYLDEVKDRIDLSRIRFLGNIGYDAFRALMQISACHVYLTYPFVLSWSMLEAMSCGALVVGSRTPPVEEVIEDGRNGFLVDFFDADGLADRVAAVLAQPHRFNELRAAARRTIIARYDLSNVCLPRQISMVEQT
jgi:glycosyltransferase involved in cell wall biosynthesis